MENQLRLFDIYDKDTDDYKVRMDIWNDWKRDTKRWNFAESTIEHFL